MRIKIVFDHLPNVKLPMNYQHIISAWIYDTLYKSDPEFGDWLHEQGFEYKGKRYKHFCFSFLSPARYRIEGRDFLLAEAPTELILSFQMEEGGKKWISQIFKDAFEFFKIPRFGNKIMNTEALCSLFKLVNFRF